MSVQIDSIRFGALEVPEESVVQFPLGLIGLGGTRYALIESGPGSMYRWLHSVEDPAIALPLLDARVGLPGFELALGEEERERIGVQDLDQADVYVTVRATEDPADTTVNLRAPLVIWQGRGHQVINTAPGADLKAPLFAAVAAAG